MTDPPPERTSVETFGHYRLESLIGRGGMGEVYRAYDTRRERTVALKRLQAGTAADDDYRERFRRESRLAARLSSPHVIPIHDFGEIDGRLYIDMRLVEGRDLAAEIVRAGPLDPARVAEIVRQVADALESAHSDGLVHRDVKPSNVLLSTHRGVDFAYLVDFGIVRDARDGGPALTTTGATIGTLAYMAPELFTGAPLDRRVDVYALTCLLFEALAGRPPFTASGAALMYQHLNVPPPRITAARPGLPPGFDDVVARGMAKHPDARYPTTSELAEAAVLAVSGRLPGTGAPPGPPPRSGPVSEPTYVPGPWPAPGPPSGAPPYPRPDTPPHSRPGTPPYPRPDSPPGGPYPGPPRTPRRTGLLVALTSAGAVLAALLVLAVVTLSGGGSGGSADPTPTPTPGPTRLALVPNSEADLALLRRAYPGSATPEQNCVPYQPSVGAFAPYTPQAVITCADQANAATLYYALWADPSQAGAYFDRLRNGRTSADGSGAWSIDNARQGPSFTGPVEGSTETFTVTVYDGERFSFTAQAPTADGLRRAYAGIGFVPRQNLPR